MYAVVSCGGKQYRVSPGDILQVERLNQQTEGKVELDKVLLINLDDESLQIGTPFIKGAKILCSYIGEQKGKKVIVFKMKRRKGYRRKKGHRQTYSLLKVEDILIDKPKAMAKAEVKPKAKPKVATKAKTKPKTKPKVEAKAKAEPKAKPKTKAKTGTKNKSTSAAKGRKT